MCCAPTRRERIQSAVTVPLKLERTVEDETASSTVPTSTNKPSVSFSKTVNTRFSLCLDDYSSSEYDACWYSQDEYQAIEKDMCRQFVKMEKGKIFNDKKYCSRGLERYLTVNAIPKTENQRNSRQAVLEEQARQRELNQCDEEAIARVYKNISSSCQMWAAVLGLRDQRDAARYIQDDDGDISNSPQSSDDAMLTDPAMIMKPRAPRHSVAPKAA